MNWKLLCWVFIGIWLSACGNKGPLVLPDAENQEKRAAKSAQSASLPQKIDKSLGLSPITKG